jgi:ubiquitin-protein ligase
MSGEILCFWQNTNENISPSVLNRLIKEVKEYSKNPVSDIVLQVNEENVTDLRAELQGPGTISGVALLEWRLTALRGHVLWCTCWLYSHRPSLSSHILRFGLASAISDADLRFVFAAAQTPYQGGYFRMRLVFGPDFPSAPPKGFFITPIFHPNVAKNGEICVNTLKKDWKADCKLSHILMVLPTLSLVFRCS